MNEKKICKEALDYANDADKICKSQYEKKLAFEQCRKITKDVLNEDLKDKTIAECFLALGIW
jgi:hypothetical protein